MLDHVAVGQYGHQRCRLCHAIAVDQSRGGESLLQRMHQRGGNRCTTIGQPPHAGHVCARKYLVPQQQRVHSRYGNQERDPLGGQQTGQCREVERRHDHRGAADVQGGQQLRITAGHVKQRHADQGAQPTARIMRHSETANHVLRVGKKCLMRSRHTFRVPGRARRVEECGYVVGTEALVDVRVTVGQRVIGSKVHPHAGVGQYEFDLR